MSSKKYAILVPAVLGLLAAIFGAVWAFQTDDQSDDLTAVAGVLSQSSQTAEAAATVAISEGNRPACIAAKSVAALTTTAAGAVSAAALDGKVCAIPALEIDASACPAQVAKPVEAAPVEAPAAEAVPAEAKPADAPAVPVEVEQPVVAEPAPAEPEAKPEQGVDVPAVVEVAIGPVLSALSDLAKAHENKAAGKWVAAALDFVNGGRKSIIDIIENPESGKLSIPGVQVQDCRNE